MRHRSARRSSFVAMMPPSEATRTFVGDKLKTSASPKPPTGAPACREPNAWAASKTSLIPLFLARAESSSTAQGVPNVWVARIRDVRTPIVRATASGESVRVFGSTSANTGRRWFQAAAWAVAAKVKDGKRASPDRPAARMTSMRPAVHELTATAWRTPRYSAARSSNLRTKGPLVRVPEERMVSTSLRTRSLGGTEDRKNCSPSGKAGGPPRMAGGSDIAIGGTIDMRFAPLSLLTVFANTLEFRPKGPSRIWDSDVRTMRSSWLGLHSRRPWAGNRATGGPLKCRQVSAARLPPEGTRKAGGWMCRERRLSFPPAGAG